MKFCWKFKKIIEEQIFKKFIKFGENLLKNSWNLLKNEQNNVNCWYLRIINNLMIRNRIDGKKLTFLVKY